MLAQAFVADMSDERFVAVSTTRVVLDEATRLVAVHPLKACDAVQLASALTASRALDEVLPFAGFDTSLRCAASAVGLTVEPLR